MVPLTFYVSFLNELQVFRLKGLPVTSLGRSQPTSTSPGVEDPRADVVGHVRHVSLGQEMSGIDALKPETFDSLLPGARAVVTLGWKSNF